MVSYNSDCHSTSYETYKQVKMTMAKNTMPSILKFKPVCNSNAKQEIVLPISYHVLVFRKKSDPIWIRRFDLN